jgi:peptidyl-prolyl cis-trans isomerase D
MFNLFRTRAKAVRYLLTVLLGLVALSMVVTLIPGFGSQTGVQSDQVVAEIGGDALSMREVQTTIQNAIKGRQVPPEMVQFYVPQFVDQLIAERAVAYQAERMGFRISDEETANAIRSMLAQYFPGEIKREDYQRFLAQQGMSVDQFENNVRRNLLLLRLQNIALEGAVVTPDEVEREYRRKNDKVKVEYVKYSPPANLASQVTVTPEEIQNYYNAQKASFQTPEKRSFNLLLADEAKIGAAYQVSDGQLRAAYNSSLDRYRTPERVRVRHILIKTTDKPAEEVAKAEAKAKDLLKQLKAGADFAELATKNSEDPGSAAKGGDLDWVTRGQTVPNFETAAFSLQPKQLSDVIKTEYGFHILQVLEKEQARVKPFEEVRDQIATDLRREGVYNRMQEAIDQARAELIRSPKDAEQIAAKYGLSYYNVQNVGPTDSLPEIGTNAELSGTVTSIRTGEVSQPVQVMPTKLAIAQVTAIQPPRQAELAEVENDIRSRITSQKVQQLTEQRLKEATETLKNAGGDLRAVAKKLGLEVKTTDFFALEGAAEGIGPASALADAFTKPVGSVVGPVSLAGDVVLAKVVEKQPADMAQLAATRESLVLELKRKKAAQRKELFEDGLITQLIREGKVKKNPEAINRVVQSYRG